ncbi:MAG: hypothetical protein A3H96_10745 [Acidobacteria bacterium RIFCSPLOWO2_02_FULL_67_36]|nr:MAG: hypothetical protein A3H96_10745 [Acidobacteria bacterium RIFCSPLOWO2_02_FULL_67_36]OFW24347.1 MAG: hypothetical protein A3G21_17425 [Acidobacteria bacterium RIFCSPLOWO2_12_FULL_66_21]
MKRAILASLIAVLACAAPLAAQSVLVVRHAERADDGSGAAMMAGKDPDLSAAGHARAASLASILKDADITAIYVSEFKRTGQTAEPLAKALGLKPTVVAAKQTAALVAAVRAASGNVLVVAHSDSIPVILEALGVEGPSKIGEMEYDNLFVITRTPKPALLRLHYR